MRRVQPPDSHDALSDAGPRHPYPADSPVARERGYQAKRTVASPPCRRAPGLNPLFAQVHIVEVSTLPAGIVVTATMMFHVPTSTHCRGECELQGTIYDGTHIQLSPTRWIDNPCGCGFVGFSGVRDDDHHWGAIMTGTIDNSGCQSFSLALGHTVEICSGAQLSCGDFIIDDVAAYAPSARCSMTVENPAGQPVGFRFMQLEMGDGDFVHFFSGTAPDANGAFHSLTGTDLPEDLIMAARRRSRW